MSPTGRTHPLAVTAVLITCTAVPAAIFGGAAFAFARMVGGPATVIGAIVAGLVVVANGITLSMAASRSDADTRIVVAPAPAELHREARAS